MAHYSIVQISKTPVPVDEYIDENDFSPEDSIYSFADYFQNMDSDEQSAERMVLKQLIGDESKDEFVLKYESDKFLDTQFKIFLMAIKDLRDLAENTPEPELLCEFKKPYGEAMHLTRNLADAIEDKSGLWVCDNYGCAMPLARWLRENPKGTYYLGGVVNFHV